MTDCAQAGMLVTSIEMQMKSIRRMSHASRGYRLTAVA
jgi:hypothetical protein